MWRREANEIADKATGDLVILCSAANPDTEQQHKSKETRKLSSQWFEAAADLDLQPAGT